MAGATSPRKITSLMIVIGVALVLLLDIESQLSPSQLILYQSFFADLVLPFAFYFVLCMSEERLTFLKHWQTKAGLIVTGTILMELLQKFGIYALGITFDPLDILMYVLGTGFAVLLDQVLLPRFIPGWKNKLSN